MRNTEVKKKKVNGRGVEGGNFVRGVNALDCIL
jgi:hypothetical protein